MTATNLHEATRRYDNMETAVVDTFTTHNSLLDKYFDKISYLSTILPNYLSQITSLSDMITDAMLLPILTDDNFEYSSVF